MKHFTVISILLTLLCSISNTTIADDDEHLTTDIIHLKNGDKITGEIISTEDDEITIATEYADEVIIKWESVANIESSRVVTIELKDKSRVKGIPVPTQPGQMSLRSDQVSNPVTINIDQIAAVNPPPVDHIPLKGHLNVGGMLSKGNTNNQLFHADGEIQAIGPNNRTTLGVLYNQAASDGEENANNGYAYLDYKHYITDKWYAFANTNFQKDKFRDLNFAAFAGGGLGYQIWDDEIKYLTFQAGPGFRYEDFNLGEDRDFAAGYWEVDYTYWVIDERMQFFHNHSGQVSLEDFSDVFIRSSTGIHLPVIENFQFTFQFDVDHDTKPPKQPADKPKLKKTDYRYIVSVGYVF